MRSVYTDGLILSVYTDRIADRIYRILKRRNNVMTWNFFRRFYRQNDQGIQTGISVQWCDAFTVRITDGYTDRTYPSVIPSIKANISTLCRLFPPLFLLLPPHPNSPPSQTATNHPSQLSPSSQHKHSSFFTTSVNPITLLWILSFFVSKSILFSFNI